MTIQLVLFDLAGTLMDDGDYARRAYRDVLDKHGIAAPDEWLRRQMGRQKQAVFADALREFAAADPEDAAVGAAALAREFEASINALMESEPTRALPTANACLDELRAQNIRLGYTTGFNRSTAELITTQQNWKFDCGAASDEVERGRPAPDLIELAMSRASCTDPGTVATVGDTPWDLLAGRAASCGKVIAVTHGTHTREELEHHPNDAILDNLADFLTHLRK